MGWVFEAGLEQPQRTRSLVDELLAVSLAAPAFCSHTGSGDPPRAGGGR